MGYFKFYVRECENNKILSKWRGCWVLKKRTSMNLPRRASDYKGLIRSYPSDDKRKWKKNEKVTQKFYYLNKYCNKIEFSKKIESLEKLDSRIGGAGMTKSQMSLNQHRFWKRKGININCCGWPLYIEGLFFGFSWALHDWYIDGADVGGNKNCCQYGILF